MLEYHVKSYSLVFKTVASYALDVLTRFTPSLVADLNIESLYKILSIMDLNSFRIDKNGSKGLFLASSMLNHSCTPNARVIFGTDGHVTVKAKKMIGQGQPITIAFCKLLTNTESRLKMLDSSQYFTCSCDLCLDNTEKGTYLSAIVCPKCKSYLLPRSFHEIDPTWTCKKCHFQTSNEKVKKLVESVRNGYLNISK